MQNSGVAVKANTEATAWIRVACECGKVIKGPPDWAGKKGHCPRCGRDIIMPRVEKPSEDGVPSVAAMAAATFGSSNAPPLRGTEDPGTSELPNSGLIDLTGSEEVRIMDGVAPAVWEGRRKARAQKMAATPRQQVRFYRQSSLFERISEYRLRALPFIHQKPATTTVVSILVLVASCAFLWYQFQPDPELPEWITPPVVVYFYDLETDEYFGHSNADPPPVLTPKQTASDKPRGVRAYIYTCSDCSPENRFVAFFETFNPTARDAWRRRLTGRRIAEVQGPLADDTVSSKIGRFVALPTDKDKFIAATDPEALPIIERAYKTCPTGLPPSQCFPPAK